MPTTVENPSLSREQWLKKLSEDEMPVFANTARLIAGELSREQRSAAELAKLILQDATMTARLLRLANSSYYNPTNCKISTVSRAIVVLGFETVRNMSLTISVIDTLVDGSNRQIIAGEMARAFHAAAQARSLATLQHDPSPEEIFIATLLLQLGKMVFWCFVDKIDSEAGGQLRQILNSGTMTNEQAEQEVLGFTLTSLTRSLNKQWKLSPLLEETLAPEVSKNSRAGTIQLGYEIADTSRKGWQSLEMEGLLEKITDTFDIGEQRLQEICTGTARQAADAISGLGIGNLGQLIPTDEQSSTIEDSGQVTDILLEPDSDDKLPEPDRDLQLSILQEISEMLDSKPDINLLMEMILEGIHRGLGMDRTVFALLNPDRTQIKAKYTLGWDRQAMMQQFRYPVTAPPSSLIDYAISNQEALWLSPEKRQGLEKFLTPALDELCGDQQCFMLPIALRGKVIGLFYADRKPSKRPLDQELFTSFKLFGQQARLGLSLV